MAGTAPPATRIGRRPAPWQEATGAEPIELMADRVYGQCSSRPASVNPAADLLWLSHKGLALYHRPPWLLEIPAGGNVPGPTALAFMGRVLAALAGTGLTGPAK